jgi:hypothetical protein
VSIGETSQIDPNSIEIIHNDVDDDEHYGLDDMERLMLEMAAKFAMRMTAMFYKDYPSFIKAK